MMFDRVNRRLRHADLQRHRLMRRPFKAAVALARRNENGDLALALTEASLKTQIAAYWPVSLAQAGRVKLDTGRAFEPPDRAASGVGATVENKLPGLVEVFATGQGQAAARFWINVFRQHFHPLI
jgi:hypothetical protein